MLIHLCSKPRLRPCGRRVYGAPGSALPSRLKVITDGELELARRAQRAGDLPERRRLQGDVRRAERVRVRHVEGVRAECEARSEEHTSELQSRQYIVCRLLLGKRNIR